MPFELGLFLAAKWFGGNKQKRKICLILDSDRYRYQKFLSDIAGQDIRSHGDQARAAICVVRDWLRTHVQNRPIPGGEAIGRRYGDFRWDLPRLCQPLQLNVSEITFADYIQLIEMWLRENP
ncbi:MAG: hypothetical protein WBC44_16345 [Planctomycetaceae bacterium]